MVEGDVIGTPSTNKGCKVNINFQLLNAAYEPSLQKPSSLSSTTYNWTLQEPSKKHISYSNR